VELIVSRDMNVEEVEEIVDLNEDSDNGPAPKRKTIQWD
jgi:hypothetical protein